MNQHGVSWLDHYIDDFITAGCPGITECTRNTELTHAMCQACQWSPRRTRDQLPPSHSWDLNGGKAATRPTCKPEDVAKELVGQKSVQEARIAVVGRFYVPHIASSQAWQELHTQTD